MAKDLMQDLQNGVVLVKYRSLKSGREKEVEATLKPDLLPNSFQLNQSADSDKILMYLVEFERWEDLEKSTIINWSKMT